MFSCLPLFPCIYFMLSPKNFPLFCKHMLLVSLLSVRMPGSSLFSLMLSMGFSHGCTLLIILNEIFFFARNRRQTRVELFYLVFSGGKFSNPYAPITPEIIGSDISPSSCCLFLAPTVSKWSHFNSAHRNPTLLGWGGTHTHTVDLDFRYEGHMGPQLLSTLNLDSALAKVPWDLTGVSLAIIQLHKGHEYAGPP